MTPAIDVIVPTFDNLDEMRLCLRSLEVQERLGTVFVCVDGSTDGTLEYLENHPPALPIAVLQHSDHRNHSRSAARNLALAHLESDFVLLLDSDMRLVPGATARHLDLIEERPGTVSIGDINYLNARENLWARYLSTRGATRSKHGEEITPLHVSAHNIAMRVEDLRAVEGFDETLTEYGGEDSDLGIRLARDRGLRFVLNGGARADTVQSKTAAEGLAQLRRYGSDNLRRLRSRYPDLPGPFWIERADSPRPVDRLLRTLLNPVSDRLVATLLPRTPWPIQRRLLNYQVIRAVFDGYLGK